MIKYPAAHIFTSIKTQVICVNSFWLSYYSRLWWSNSKLECYLLIPRWCSHLSFRPSYVLDDIQKVFCSNSLAFFMNITSKYVKKKKRERDRFVYWLFLNSPHHMQRCQEFHVFVCKYKTVGFFFFFNSYLVEIEPPRSSANCFSYSRNWSWGH